MNLKSIFLLVSLLFLSVFLLSPEEGMAAEQGKVELTKILDNGADGKRKVILVIGEGYSEADKAKYYADVQRNILQGALAHDAFQANQKGFNVYRIDAWSKESGVSHVKGQQRKSFFGLKVNDLEDVDIARILKANDVTNYFEIPKGFFDIMARAESAIGHCDVVVVLLNDGTDNGATYGNHWIIAGRGFDWKVMCHELGHALVNLYDEYSYPDCPYQGPARNFLNSSTLKDRVSVAWAAHLGVETKVPTPLPSFSDKSPTKNGIGVFEGGATFDKGIYHPGFTCRMNEHTKDSFCLVCADLIGAALNQWLPNPKPLPYQKEMPRDFDINGIKGYSNFGFSLHKADAMYDFGIGKLKSMSGSFVQNSKYPIGNYVVESYQKDGKIRTTQFIGNPFERHNGFHRSGRSTEGKMEMEQGWTFFNLPYASKDEAISKGLGVRIYKIKARDLSAIRGAGGAVLLPPPPPVVPQVLVPIKPVASTPVKVQEKAPVKSVLAGKSMDMSSYPMTIDPGTLDTLRLDKRLELIVDMKPEKLADAMRKFREVELEVVR